MAFIEYNGKTDNHGPEPWPHRIDAELLSSPVPSQLKTKVLSTLGDDESSVRVSSFWHVRLKVLASGPGL